MGKMIFQLVTPVGGLEEKPKIFWLLVQMLCNWATGDSVVEAKATNLQSATKWVDTFRPKLGFFMLYWLQKEDI